MAALMWTEICGSGRGEASGDAWTVRRLDRLKNEWLRCAHPSCARMGHLDLSQDR